MVVDAIVSYITRDSLPTTSSFASERMWQPESDDNLIEPFLQGGQVSITRFLAALREAGLKEKDPRLKVSMRELHSIQKNYRRRCSNAAPTDFRQIGARRQSTVFNQKLLVDKQIFKRCIADGTLLISRALTKQLCIPDWNQFSSKLQEIFDEMKSDERGKVANYIPRLGKFRPDQWGMSVCTVDGQRASFGDSKMKFTIQSASKPLLYGIALNDLGSSYVHNYVGHEPSGHLFNDIVLDSNNKPHNPLINAGAIVTLSIIKKNLSLSERFEYLISMFKKLAGGETVDFSNSTFLSERDNSDRNFALAHFLKYKKALPHDANVTELLEFYFQLCSVEVTCESASVIAATLAFGGICPITGERVLSSDSVKNLLSLMYSCGMYDFSGQFAFRVGLPAKSGVSGILLVVVPNYMGFALWSPNVDKHGNSVRGVGFCEKLVETFNFHNYDSRWHSGTQLDPRLSEKNTPIASKEKVVHVVSAAAAGDLDSLRRYVVQGVSMDEVDYDGRTALHLCATEGHEEIVQFLLYRCHARTDIKDRWGKTALMAALESSNSDCYRIIEEYLQLHNEKLTNGSAEETTEREDKNKDDNNNNAISNKSSVNNNTPSDKNQLKNVSFEELAEADRPYIVRRRAIKTHKFPHSQQFVNLSL